MGDRLHYSGLANYQSYDLAWLGPIVYPLTLGLVAQLFIYVDLILHRCCPTLRHRYTKKASAAARPSA